MRAHGLHILVTYGCNASCGHCFLAAGPRKSPTMDEQNLARLLDSAGAGQVDHVFLEGGEPFLLGERLLPLVAEVKRRGHWLGLLTNGFFAVDEPRARGSLEPLVSAGLDSIGVSTDIFHARNVPVERATLAARTAASMGIDASIMFSDDPADPKRSAALLRKVKRQARGVQVWNGPISCRGRAFSLVTSGEAHRWQTLTRCRENHSDPSRVHIGPEGEVHLCQGLLLGESAFHQPLSELLSPERLSAHPIASVLREGGPAALARIGIAHGFEPAPTYPDGCALCYDIRRNMLGVWPGLLGPASVYKPA